MVLRLILALLCVGCVVSFPIPREASDSLLILKKYINNIPSNQMTTKCVICKVVVQMVHTAIAKGIGKSIMVKGLYYICDKFEIASHRICIVGVLRFSDALWNIFVRGLIKPHVVCGMLLGVGCAHIITHDPSWNVTIPKPTKLIRPSNTGVKTGAGATMKVIHISDTHLDNDYQEGSVAVCEEPLCCRKNDRIAGKGEEAAGKYGFAGFCDTNILMLHSMLSDMVVHHKDVEYILWTGDVPPHDVWNQSRTTEKNDIIQAAHLLREYFPNTTIFPTLGNHEGMPVNCFPPPEIWRGNISSEWLYDTIAENWKGWLPEAAQPTIKRGGYYTALIREGLRIVSLNMNFGYADNWWLVLYSHDPAGQLQWLTSVLSQAEKDDEKVHIIGHVPPNHNVKWWSFNFYRIVERFQHTITAQFYGHTHHDEYNLFYDMKTFKIPTNIVYIGPSVTTYHELNPGYRVYEVDARSTNSSMSVVDHHTYILDLAKVQKTAIAKWELEYSAKETYGLKDLSPSSWNDLTERMKKDNKLFQKYYRNFYKQHDQRKKCDDQCKEHHLCSIKSTSSSIHNFCNFDKERQRLYSIWWSNTYNKC